MPTNIVPYAFPVELLSGTHQFQTGGNNFYLALYTANPYTNTAGAQAATAYTTNVEVSSSGGSNYTAGGNLLTGQAVSNVANVATVDFADSVWGVTPGPASFTAAYATIYNDTNSDKLVVLLDFGGSKTCSNGTFTVTFPSPTAGTPSGSDAILSITS
jgi:hypothetical protein